MALYCKRCWVPAPCGHLDHDMYPSSWVAVPTQVDVSVACWALDHVECTVPVFCTCFCHQPKLDEEPPITAPPSNR